MFQTNDLKNRSFACLLSLGKPKEAHGLPCGTPSSTLSCPKLSHAPSLQARMPSWAKPDSFGRQGSSGTGHPLFLPPVSATLSFASKLRSAASHNFACRPCAPYLDSHTAIVEEIFAARSPKDEAFKMLHAPRLLLEKWLFGFYPGDRII